MEVDGGDYIVMTAYEMAGICLFVIMISGLIGSFLVIFFENYYSYTVAQVFFFYCNDIYYNFCIFITFLGVCLFLFLLEYELYT